MSSIKNNPEMDFLDVRNKPEWEILDLKDETDNFEHELFESIGAEFVDVAGFPIEFYLMKPGETLDKLYGEDPLLEFEGPFKTKIAYDPVNEETMIDMFGFSSDDNIQYAEMPKIIFERDIMLQTDTTIDIEYLRDDRAPIPGDVIKTLWDGKIWELVNVSSGEKIFHGKKLVWSFTMKPYRHGNESESAETMVFSTLELDEFPPVNSTTEHITNEEYLEENNDVTDELADEIDNYLGNEKFMDDDIDTSAYGYIPKSKRG